MKIIITKVCLATMASLFFTILGSALEKKDCTKSAQWQIGIMGTLFMIAALSW